MGLSWQQGPIGSGSVGRFLVADPLPERLLFADSEDVILLHVLGRYPWPTSSVTTWPTVCSSSPTG